MRDDEAVNENAYLHEERRALLATIFGNNVLVTNLRMKGEPLEVNARLRADNCLLRRQIDSQFGRLSGVLPTDFLGIRRVTMAEERQATIAFVDAPPIGEATGDALRVARGETLPFRTG